MTNRKRVFWATTALFSGLLVAGAASAQQVAQGTLNALGLSGLEVGSLGSMQLFWIAAAALVAMAAAGAMRLAQDV